MGICDDCGEPVCDSCKCSHKAEVSRLLAENSALRADLAACAEKRGRLREAMEAVVKECERQEDEDSDARTRSPFGLGCTHQPDRIADLANEAMGREG